MEFLNPRHRKRHFIQLYVGYVLMAVAIGLAAFILLLVAFGFGIGDNGQLVRKGLLFVSSRPGGAEIYMDGAPIGEVTDARLNLSSSTYFMQLKRDGYRIWQREINVIGGQVLRVDYPLLFPVELNTENLKIYGQKPPLVVSTPNNRWLLVLKTDNPTYSFDMYDTTQPEQAPEELVLPANLYATAERESWRFVEWADDQNNVLIQHNYGTNGAREFILFDRSNPAQSINLSSWFGRQFSQISFVNNQSDQFYLYDGSEDVLWRASLSQPEPERIAGNVLTYESFDADGVAYINRVEGEQRALLQLKNGSQTTVVRQLPGGGGYKLAVSSYKGDFYLGVASKKLNASYVYKNPIQQINNQASPGLSVAAILPIKNPGHLSFSVGGRLMLAEKGRQFAVYDSLYEQSYHYDFTKPLDAGQKHATWLDGAHLQYVSNGQLFVFDFDGKNDELLIPAISNLSVHYSQNQESVFALAPLEGSKTGEVALTFTPLRTPADQ